MPIVYVVDDDASIRESLGFLLDPLDVEVISCASGERFLEVFRPLQSGCVLLDVRMPDISGLDIVRHHVPHPIDMPVIMLTAHGTVGSAVQAVRDGAVMMVEKPFDGEAIVALVQRTIEDDQPRWRRRLERAELLDLLRTLTPRELEVLSFAVRGRTSQEVGGALGISYRTVEVHRSRILQKTRCQGITELVYRMMDMDLGDWVDRQVAHAG